MYSKNSWNTFGLNPENQVIVADNYGGGAVGGLKTDPPTGTYTPGKRETPSEHLKECCLPSCLPGLKAILPRVHKTAIYGRTIHSITKE